MPLAVVSGDKDSVAAIHSGSRHLGERPGPARRREPPPPIRSGPLHPTRQRTEPLGHPWWASRPRHVSFRGIMSTRGRGPVDMSEWISSPTPRNADAVRDMCRLRHSVSSDPRSGRSLHGRGPSPGMPLSGAGGVGRDDGPRPKDLSFRLTLTHKRLQGSCEPCIKKVHVNLVSSPLFLSFRLTLTHKRLQGSSEPCIKSSVLEGFRHA